MNLIRLTPQTFSNVRRSAAFLLLVIPAVKVLQSYCLSCPRSHTQNSFPLPKSFTPIQRSNCCDRHVCHHLNHIHRNSGRSVVVSYCLSFPGTLTSKQRSYCLHLCGFWPFLKHIHGHTDAGPLFLLDNTATFSKTPILVRQLYGSVCPFWNHVHKNVDGLACPLQILNHTNTNINQSDASALFVLSWTTITKTLCPFLNQSHKNSLSFPEPQSQNLFVLSWTKKDPCTIRPLL